jgi:hypothetical protein
MPLYKMKLAAEISVVVRAPDIKTAYLMEMEVNLGDADAELLEVIEVLDGECIAS